MPPFDHTPVDLSIHHPTGAIFNSLLDEISGLLDETLEDLARATGEIHELEDNQAWWLKPDGGLDSAELERMAITPREKCADELAEHVHDVWRHQASALRALLVAKDQLRELKPEVLALNKVTP